MNTIGLIGAMDEEVAILKEQMTDTKEMTKAGMTFVEGTLWGLKTVVVVSGIGKVNMAVCTQILIDIFSVDTVINTGVARSIIHWKLVILCFRAVPSSMTWMFRHLEIRSASSREWMNLFLPRMKLLLNWQKRPVKKQTLT